MKKVNFYALIAITGMFVLLISSSCNKSSSTVKGSSVNASQSLDAAWSKMYGIQSITRDGDFWVVTTNDLPSHKSVYYKGTQWESALYEPYTSSTFQSNNAPIASQNITFRIPAKPVVASIHKATPLGPIGIAVNGVCFFNQYAGNGQKLGAMEINSFDQYKGHCTPMNNQYHYHVEPTYLTQTKGTEALMGFLLDGFPVYGPVENGKTLSNSDLDIYHGHIGKTKEYPNGIYHYHITSTDPYINGSGFYGTAGTVSQ